MSPKEWLAILAIKVACLTTVVILILLLNYSTWDGIKDLRATLMIVIYYIAQSIVSSRVSSRASKVSSIEGRRST